MVYAEVLGWVAVAISLVIGLPQLLRIVRTRSVAGLSFFSWRAILGVNLAWIAHGIRIHQLPMVLTNTFSLVTTVLILTQMSRVLQRTRFSTFAPGLVVAAAMVATDVLFGSAMYGVLAIAAGVVASTGASIELIRALHVGAVSTVFLVLGVVNQLVWLTWSLLVGDPGSIMTASTMTALTTFNLAWYVLRRLGLRPFFPHETAGATGRHQASGVPQQAVPEPVPAT
ncbi:MAG TPA: PQ-loop domain-containing transporter [Propionibacteriaceae bacterium]|nr:PQ-loop domain-containing transporter [Propionibacteriaceae bacterium]